MMLDAVATVGGFRGRPVSLAACNDDQEILNENLGQEETLSQSVTKLQADARVEELWHYHSASLYLDGFSKIRKPAAIIVLSFVGFSRHLNCFANTQKKSWVSRDYDYLQLVSSLKRINMNNGDSQANVLYTGMSVKCYERHNGFYQWGRCSFSPS